MREDGSLPATSGPRFIEDVPQLAAEAFRLAGEFCGACRDFHALWPYVRLAGASRAAEGGRTVTAQLLADHFLHGRRRVLIAGAADTGLLALVAQVGANSGVSITIVDRCRTPLELCRRFAQRWSISIETEQQDLTEFDSDERYDLVFVHSLLPYIAADRRIAFAQRMHGALQPDGRLIMLFRTSRRITGSLQQQYHDDYVSWILDELKRRDVPLPEPHHAFAQRLAAYALAHEARQGVTSEPDEVADLLDAAGFDVVSLSTVTPQPSAAFKLFGSRLSRRGFVAEAKPR